MGNGLFVRAGVGKQTLSTKKTAPASTMGFKATTDTLTSSALPGPGQYDVTTGVWCCVSYCVVDANGSMCVGLYCCSILVVKC